MQRGPAGGSRRKRGRKFVAGACALSAPLTLATLAGAQPSQPPDGVPVGDFWFRPRVELRPRGEYFHPGLENHVHTVPILDGRPAAPLRLEHQWVVHQRSRVGLEVERGVLAAAIVIQDARIFGYPTPLAPGGTDDRATTSFYAAYLEARTAELRPSFFRVGRQEVAWGEGRLLGISDWFLRPRSLDAVRARWASRLFDVEALAVLLSPPGSVPLEHVRQIPGSPDGSGSGVQLYGLDAIVHVDPLLHGEVMGLTRIARSPLPGSLFPSGTSVLRPSDTFVVDGRVFGERGGFGYAAEFAYEFGRLAMPGGRSISAWAATAHADWQTNVVFRPKIMLGGSYATGGDGSTSGSVRTFDPILPDARAGLGQMGLYAWSNILDGWLSISAAPFEDLGVTLAYRHVRLAEPGGPWFAASLAPIGQSPSNQSGFLGHEIDAAVRYTPLDVLAIRAGYGALATGEGARTILSGRPDGGPRWLSAAFLEVRATVP